MMRGSYIARKFQFLRYIYVVVIKIIVAVEVLCLSDMDGMQ